MQGKGRKLLELAGRNDGLGWMGMEHICTLIYVYFHMQVLWICLLYFSILYVLHARCYICITCILPSFFGIYFKNCKQSLTEVLI